MTRAWRASPFYTYSGGGIIWAGLYADVIITAGTSQIALNAGATDYYCYYC